MDFAIVSGAIFNVTVCGHPLEEPQRKRACLSRKSSPVRLLADRVHPALARSVSVTVSCLPSANFCRHRIPVAALLFPALCTGGHTKGPAADESATGPFLILTSD